MKRGWGPAPARIKGQPLFVIGVVLVGWIAFRASMIQLPGADRFRHLPLVEGATAIKTVNKTPNRPDIMRQAIQQDEAPHHAGFDATPMPSPLPQRPVDWDGTSKDRMAAGQTMLWMAAMSEIPIPAEVTRLAGSAEAGTKASSFTQQAGRWTPMSQVSPTQIASNSYQRNRWSADGWLLLRQGSGSGVAVGGVQPPVYGLSQIGAVLRYRLAPASRYRPSAYLRASQGLVRQGEGEMAVGFAARPVPALPVTAHVEARASLRAAGTEIRPAAFVTTGIDDAPLPLGFSGRGYMQAGYVGGSFATGFADGSVVAERTLVQKRDMRVNAGAGTWGGIQRGAKRLDMGPSVSLKLSLGPVPARVALDYRLRVMGDAEPTSGAVFTLSTGF